uniref:Polyprotein n=1 Tax=Caliciviridae sp. TaxID=1916234 RepID=A0A6M9Z868_9CALI|nr:MAG: polyprotein [Caliciviridae sp.]
MASNTKSTTFTKKTTTAFDSIGNRARRMHVAAGHPLDIVGFTTVFDNSYKPGTYASRKVYSNAELPMKHGPDYANRIASALTLYNFLHEVFAEKAHEEAEALFKKLQPRTNCLCLQCSGLDGEDHDKLRLYVTSLSEKFDFLFTTHNPELPPGAHLQTNESVLGTLIETMQRAASTTASSSVVKDLIDAGVLNTLNAQAINKEEVLDQLKRGEDPLADFELTKYVSQDTILTAQDHENWMKECQNSSYYRAVKRIVAEYFGVADLKNTDPLIQQAAEDGDLDKLVAELVTEQKRKNMGADELRRYIDLHRYSTDNPSARSLLVSARNLLSGRTAVSPSEGQHAYDIIHGRIVLTRRPWSERVAEWFDSFTEKHRDALWYKCLRKVLAALWYLTGWEQFVSNFAEALLVWTKLPVVCCILNAYDGTTEGLVATAVCLLQLFDLFDPATIVDAAQALAEMIMNLLDRGMAWLRGTSQPSSIQQNGTLQDRVPTYLRTLAIPLIGGMLSLGADLYPGPVSHKIRRVILACTTFTGLLHAVSEIRKVIREAEISATVTEYMTTAHAFATCAADPATTSSAEVSERLERALEEFHKKVDEKFSQASFVTQHTAHRAITTVLMETKRKLTIMRAAQQPRAVPAIIVLQGPPGIGKTMAARRLAAILSKRPPSYFDLHMDHHDTYSGEPVCIWDEFDTDKDQQFVETIIRMGNTVAMPLNCDLVENKGKVFCSNYVICTTNQMFPIKPEHPRANAFYRRLRIVEVSAPSLSNWMAKNPGQTPPPHMYLADYSHLKLHMRKDPTKAAVDTNADRLYSLEELADMMVKESVTRNGRLQEVSTRVEIYCEGCSVDAAFDMLSKHFSPDNSFASLTTSTRRTQLSPGYVVALVDKPSTHSLTARGLTDSPDLNTALDLFPKLPKDINKHLHSRVFHSAFHLGQAPPSKMHIAHTYHAKSALDLGGIFAREYGFRSLSVAWGVGRAMTKATWNEAFQRFANLSFPDDNHSFVVYTPVGSFYVFSNHRAQVFAVTTTAYNPARTVQLTPPDSLGKMILDIGRRFFSAVLANLHLIFAGVAVNYYTRQAAHRPQAAPITAYQNPTLTDDQYREWQDARRHSGRNYTVDEYLLAKAALDGLQRDVAANVQPLVDFLRDRQTGLARMGQLQDRNSVCYRPIYRDDGSFASYGTHIGHGYWLINRHTWYRAELNHLLPLRIDDTILTQCNHPLTRGDVLVVRGPVHEVSTHLSDGVPVRFADNRPVTHVQPFCGEIEEAEIEGYLGMMMGGTEDGSCGMPYFDATGGVCAIHSAYITSTAQIVCSQIKAIPTQKVTTWRTIPVTNSGVALGPLPKGTAFGRSPAHPERYSWEDCEPTAYGSGDPRGLPRQEALLAAQLEPYVGSSVTLPATIHEAIYYVHAYFKDLLKLVPPPVLESPAQAMLRLDLSTSCGPFVDGVKSDYCVHTGSEIIYDPASAFGLHIHAMIATAAAGRPIKNAYKLALKDELLPVAKTRQKKRLLWGTDVALTLLANMVWGSLFDRLKSLVLVSPCAVGCNMDSNFVNVLAGRFAGRHTICMDYSKWDSTMHPDVIVAAVNILCDLVPPSPYCTALRATLSQQPQGYFGDKVVTTTRGLPSGIPGTSILNSICHCILYTSAIWLCQDLAGIARDASPLDDCPIVTYGDDCIYGLSGRVAANLERFIDALRIHGLKPTSPDKSDHFTLDGPLVFLKRTLSINEGKLVAPIELMSLLRQLVWVKGTKTLPHTAVKNPGADRKVQIQEVLIALTCHGKEAYEEWLPLAEQTIVGEGLTGICTDYTANWATYRSRFAVADCSANEFLKITAKLQNNEREHQATPDASSTHSTGLQTAASAGQGLVNPSYTGTGVPVGAAAAPEPQSSDLALAATGQASGVPQEVYGIWVLSRQLTWSTQHVTGTHLGTLRLEPALNPFLSLISRMYSGWAGGMLVRVMLSASGVYAGRLTVAVLPPGISPEKVANPTAYPCVIVDARLVNPMEINLPDVRRSLYHEMDGGDETSSLSVWVNSPLINPFSTAVDANSVVTVQIYTTPSPDFMFTLLTEPKPDTVMLADAMGDSTKNWFDNRFLARPSSLRTLRVLQQSYNHFNISGTTPGWGNACENQVVVVRSPGNMQVNRIQFVTGVAHDDVVIDPRFNMPSNWRDCYCFVQGTTGGTQVTPRLPMARMACAEFSDNGDVSEQVPQWIDIGYATDEPTGTQESFTRIAGLGTIAIVPTGNQVSSGNNFALQFMYFSVNKDWSTSEVPIINAPDAPIAYSRAGNLVLGLDSAHLSSYPNGVHLTASQPISLSRFLRDHPIPYNPDTMHLFRFSGDTDTFEVALTHDGYLMTGGNATTTIDLTRTDYDITYTGPVSISTVLRGPMGNTRASRSRVCQ